MAAPMSGLLAPKDGRHDALAYWAGDCLHFIGIFCCRSQHRENPFTRQQLAGELAKNSLKLWANLVRQPILRFALCASFFTVH